MASCGVSITKEILEAGIRIWRYTSDSLRNVSSLGQQQLLKLCYGFTWLMYIRNDFV